MICFAFVVIKQMPTTRELSSFIFKFFWLLKKGRESKVLLGAAVYFKIPKFKLSLMIMMYLFQELMQSGRSFFKRLRGAGLVGLKSGNTLKARSFDWTHHHCNHPAAGSCS